jgi:lysozyme
MAWSQKGRLAGVALTGAVALVTAWEGRELLAYPDVIDTWTICYGDTHGVREGQTATPAECDKRLYARLQQFDADLSKCVTYQMPPGVHAALISLTYNVGPSAICRSTLVRKLNAGDIVGACNEFPRWRFAGGKEVRGLLNRRKAEMAVCLAGARA